MKTNTQIFEDALYKIITLTSEINLKIINRKISSVSDIKKIYIKLKRKIAEFIPKDMVTSLKDKNINCCKELDVEIDKCYSISLQLFKSFWWGEFARLNGKNFSELYKMMVNQDGDLRRSFDDFPGTVAIMDFHGYTQFSKDIKYNKTPLQEFGDILPRKIETICTICRSIVYEMEGDALIIIGPENPVYILNAVLCIIELCKQKQFKPDINPKIFHKIDINNPMIKPFELNAAITTGGRIFINKNGHIIGSLISEASRILKIINTKKPNKSGILLSDKVYRKLDKSKETETNCHVSIFDFSQGEPFLVDVKGTRLNIREIYLENKKYIEDTKEYSNKLSEEIKKKTSGKWLNILSYYLNLIIACLNDIKCTFQVGSDTYTQDKIRKKLEIIFYDWLSDPTYKTINEILKIANILFETSEEIRDVIAVYHQFVHDNYKFIAKSLEDFYEQTLEKEGEASSSSKKIIDAYEREKERIKTRFPEKRIIGTILKSEKMNSQMLDVPYLGKK